jgi:hypothetical protein
MSAWLIAHRKYNICGWLICGEWKLADVVVREEGGKFFYSYL